MDPPTYQTADFARSPLMFYYEVTLACDLVCKHCRASAQEKPHPDELTTEQAKTLLSQAATFPRRPTVVLTGGDPLKRRDLIELVRHAVDCGLEPVLTPSATPLATAEAFQRVREAGVRRLGISLDGADARTHDAFRGWEGSFKRTLGMLRAARDLGLAVQVNTTVCGRNVQQLDAVAELLASHGIAMWAVFFLVPVGRGVQEESLSAEACEQVFERLFHHARTQPYAVKTTEAPHYRRFVLQQGADPLAGPAKPPAEGKRGQSPFVRSTLRAVPANGDCPLFPADEMPAAQSQNAVHARGHRAPLGVIDGRGIMFVSHTGEIYPAGFLPLGCGRFPQDSVVQTYQSHPTFLALRDPDHFKGKCGVCEYRQVCGGSRARAYAMTGDPLESDPSCLYVPKAMAR
jgi:radical SAM protein with 4Fe4S-binding SPASM domain